MKLISNSINLPPLGLHRTVPKHSMGIRQILHYLTP